MLSLYKNIICTTIYQAASNYHDEFFNSLLALNSLKYTLVLIYEDEYDLNEDIKSKLKTLCDVKTITNKNESSIIEKRIHLMHKAIEMDGENIIFIDSDDCFTSNGVDLHTENLKNADFSFSDQILIDSESNLLNRTLFSNSNVPDELNSPTDLLQMNYCGLSALAFKKTALEKIELNAIPNNILALDWFLCTQALTKGLIGKKTKDSVVLYRQHSDNTFKKDSKKELVLRKIQFTINHLSHFKEDSFVLQKETLEKCLAALKRDDQMAEDLFKSYNSTLFPWFEDISKLAKQYKKRYNHGK